MVIDWQPTSTSVVFTNAPDYPNGYKFAAGSLQAQLVVARKEKRDGVFERG